MVRFVFAVRDTGPGIPAEDRNHIFDAFTQSRAGTHAAGGTGLGLAISREFARLLGGELALAGSSPTGSTFCLEIPLNEASGAVPVDDRDEEDADDTILGLMDPQDAKRILVVEDHDAGRELVARYLSAVGFEVQTAVHGKAALEQVDACPPDLILMDLNMPVMDGYEAIRRLRADTRFARLPIIALTAHAFEDDHKATMEAGADAYLRKPFREAELFQAIAGLLHVQYRLADKQPRTNGSRPEVPDTPVPEEIRTRLREALATADIEEILTNIKRLRPDHAAWADALEEPARQYDYDRLQRMLEQHPDDDQSSGAPV